MVTTSDLAFALSALGSLPRLRIIAALQSEPTHVSELARRLEMSRPLLYTHLGKLQAAGLVESQLEPASEGVVKKYFWTTQFRFEVTSETIRDLIEHDKKAGNV